MCVHVCVHVMCLRERGSIYACVCLCVSLFLYLSGLLAGWLSCCLCISACACVMYVAAGHTEHTHRPSEVAVGHVYVKAGKINTGRARSFEEGAGK